MTKSIRGLKATNIAILALTLWIGVRLSSTPAFAGESMTDAKASTQEGKTFAQKLVDDAIAKHPELAGLEMAATPPGKQTCVTIAATEAKDLAEKCDKDEFTAMRTGKPFVEKEADGFDITLPLHDASGKMIGTLGMDFKPEPGQQEPGVVERAKQIASELEKQIPSKDKLFKSAE